MSDGSGPVPGAREAGAFGPWMRSMLAVLRAEPGATVDVPCEGCTACCESSQFVLVEPDEHAARSLIPAELLFPAPGAPEGYSVLPYDQHGRCPMLGSEGCLIYEHRPRTCRAYDCRVLAAADVDPGPEKPAIGRRVSEWRFAIDGPDDEAALAAVRSAAAFLGEHGDELPAGTPPPTQLAAMALEVHGLFVDGGSPGAGEVVVELRRRVEG